MRPIDMMYMKVGDIPGRSGERLSAMASSRAWPEGCEVWAKETRAVLEYSLPDGSSLSSEVSLACFIAAATDGTILDAFCCASRPFEMRTEDDFAALSSLFDSYREDLAAALSGADGGEA